MLVLNFDFFFFQIYCLHFKRGLMCKHGWNHYITERCDFMPKKSYIVHIGDVLPFACRIVANPRQNENKFQTASSLDLLHAGLWQSYEGVFYALSTFVDFSTPPSP